ncbi:MAG: TonB-dependent receptor [Pseudomonadota bacterium]
MKNFKGATWLILGAALAVGTILFTSQAVLAQDSSANTENTSELNDLLSSVTAPDAADDKGSTPPADAPADTTSPEVSATAVATEQPAPVEIKADETLPLIPVKTAEPSQPQHARLEEIVVTATKRAENARDLPSSVVALSGSDLEQMGMQGQEDFLKLVPGVTFTNDGITASRITFRGIGADLNTSNTVGVFLGDVPFDDPILPRVTLDPNPFDMARIEVLKGPQGTLFGGSALNGAVRYIPEEPQLGQWGVKTYGQYENVISNDSGRSFGGAINIPVGETVAFRFVGFDRKSPGWVDDLGRNIDNVNAVDQQGGRALALWRPSDNWKISALATIQRTFIHDSPITDNTDGNLSRSNTPQASPTHSRYDLESIGVQYSFEKFDVLSQTSRTHKSFHAIADSSRIGGIFESPPPSLTVTNDNESTSYMQELRFTSNNDFSDTWKWLGGIFYRKHEMNEVSNILASSLELPLISIIYPTLEDLIPGIGGTITPDGQINLVQGKADPIIVTDAALFSEVTATFWDDLEITLGLRAFRAISDSRVLFSGPLALPKTLPQGTTQGVSAGRLVAQGLNPKFAVKYQISDDINIYGSVSKGFRYGGAQVLVGTLTSPSPETFKSDYIWNYEIGLRTNWLDNTLFVDVTPFYLEWKQPQLQQADASGLGSYFDNVGGARSLGVETAVRYLTFIPGLELAFSGSYVDTVTTEEFTASGGDLIQPGTRWPLAAQWQSSSTVSYSRNLWSSWMSGASATYTTISSAPNTLNYLDTVFGYKTLDLNLTLRNPEIMSKPELSITLSNATDTRGIISGANNPQFLKDHVYIRPRTLIARLSFNF